jgi:hypothetical protein
LASSLFLAPAKPPDPPFARKFFAGSAPNCALSLRFRYISATKVAQKGALGRFRSANVGEMLTKCGRNVGFGAVLDGLTGCLPALTQSEGRITNFPTQHPLRCLGRNFLQRFHSIREFGSILNSSVTNTNLHRYGFRSGMRARPRRKFFASVAVVRLELL